MRQGAENRWSHNTYASQEEVSGWEVKERGVYKRAI